MQGEAASAATEAAVSYTADLAKIKRLDRLTLVRS